MLIFDHISEAALHPSNEHLIDQAPLKPPYCYVRTFDVAKQEEIDRAFNAKIFKPGKTRPALRGKKERVEEPIPQSMRRVERVLVSIGQMLQAIPGEVITYRPENLPEDEQYCERLISVEVA